MTLREKIIDEPKLEKHITVFLDILGSSASLLELDQAMENKASENQVERLRKKALYSAQRLRVTIDSASEGIRATKSMPSDLSNLTPEDIEVLQRVVKADAHYQASSDSFLLFISVSDENRVEYMDSLLDMLHVISYATVCMLAFGHAIRGAISIGWGAKILDDEILGAGIVRSHDLEKRKAIYPRIIIDDKIISIIQQALKSNEHDSETKLCRYLARLCMKIIYEDRDGEYVVDFRNPIALQHAPKDLIKDLKASASRFVYSSLMESLAQRNWKLIWKYSWLSHYFLVGPALVENASVGDE